MTFLVDGSLGGTFPSWTTSGRPASPAVGQMGYNTTNGSFDMYQASGWVSNITSGTSGTILQTQYYQGPQGSGTSTSTSYVDDGVSATITPISASSRLYVVCTTGCSVSGGYAYLRILENISGYQVQEVPWGNFSGSPQQLNAFTMTGWYVPGNTTTRTFKLQGKCTSGTRYINYSMYPNMTIYEVAA
jgi:hypothetical protein